jgi:hypothetical protein
VEFAAQPRLCAVLYKTTKQAVNLSVHEDGGRPRTGISEILETEAIITEISMPWHNEKYPEVASVVQEVHKVPSDIENLAGCTPAKVGKL